MSIHLLDSLLLLLLLTACSGPVFGQEPSEQRKANERPLTLEVRADEPFGKATAKEMSTTCALLDTDIGEIRFEFFPEEAPETVRNFLNLAALGAFDTTTFSRIVRNFVVQGGNVSTRAEASVDIRRRANRRIPDEPNRISHLRGTVSLARPEQPNSATSHFFVLVADSTFLDGTFSAFGRVTSGMEVVDRINGMEVDGEKPLSPVKLKRVSLFQCDSNP